MSPIPEPFCPSLLAKSRLAGYDTVLSGKMHFVGADQLRGFRKQLVNSLYPTDFRWTPARAASELASGMNSLTGTPVSPGCATGHT